MRVDFSTATEGRGHNELSRCVVLATHLHTGAIVAVEFVSLRLVALLCAGFSSLCQPLFHSLRELALACVVEEISVAVAPAWYTSFLRVSDEPAIGIIAAANALALRIIGVELVFLWFDVALAALETPLSLALLDVRVSVAIAVRLKKIPILICINQTSFRITNDKLALFSESSADAHTIHDAEEFILLRVELSTNSEAVTDNVVSDAAVVSVEHEAFAIAATRGKACREFNDETSLLVIVAGHFLAVIIDPVELIWLGTGIGPLSDSLLH